MKELLGQEITAILTNDDHTYLVFILETFSNPEYLIYEAVGDCCSTSWFESINNQECLIGHKIIGIEMKKEFPPDDQHRSDPVEDDDGDCISIYGYTIKTEAGYSDIEFRNASNGYYGGWCEYKPDLKLEKGCDYIALKDGDKEIAKLKPWKNEEE